MIYLAVVNFLTDLFLKIPVLEWESARRVGTTINKEL